MAGRLTARAHDAVARILKPGDTAIDATAGNGHDTAFLARTVGATGLVLAFDIQSRAIDACRRRLAEETLSARVTLIAAGHETLAARLPAASRGRVAAVMFNLGYLPGADRDVTTQAETSVEAIEAAAAQLGAGGIMTVMAYRGHPGGREEAQAVADACRRLRQVGFSARETAADGDGPVLWIVHAPAR